MYPYNQNTSGDAKRRHSLFYVVAVKPLLLERLPDRDNFIDLEACQSKILKDLFGWVRSDRHKLLLII